MISNSYPDLNIKNKLLFNNLKIKDFTSTNLIQNASDVNNNKNNILYNNYNFSKNYNIINNNKNGLLKNNLGKPQIEDTILDNNYLAINCNEKNRFNDLFQRENIPKIIDYINLINYSSNNKIPNYNNIYLNSKSFPYNLNNYKFNNNFNINNNKEFNSINTNNNKNIFSKSLNIILTDILSNKNGINQIKNLLKLEKYNIDLIRKIILILKEEHGLHIVFKNVYGNYFIQELFRKMNNELIQLIIDLISSEFVNIAMTSSGTHCLQELLNYVKNSEMEISILKAIKYKEKEMALDFHATYVLQKIILIIPDIRRVKLNEILIENTKELSLNTNSVFVIKK